MDWSEPYLKLEQSHKSIKDALNQERYEDAEDLILSIMDSTDELYKFLINKLEAEVYPVRDPS